MTQNINTSLEITVTAMVIHSDRKNFLCDVTFSVRQKSMFGAQQRNYLTGGELTIEETNGYYDCIPHRINNVSCGENGYVYQIRKDDTCEIDVISMINMYVTAWNQWFSETYGPALSYIGYGDLLHRKDE